MAFLESAHLVHVVSSCFDGLQKYLKPWETHFQDVAPWSLVRARNTDTFAQSSHDERNIAGKGLNEFRIRLVQTRRHVAVAQCNPSTGISNARTDDHPNVGTTWSTCCRSCHSIQHPSRCPRSETRRDCIRGARKCSPRSTQLKVDLRTERASKDVDQASECVTFDVDDRGLFIAVATLERQSAWKVSVRPIMMS